ncbi:MAG TPA: serpin family protein [Parafilimonas sp.]|nr:serpin family protein [Parafilimonas sp.]
MRKIISFSSIVLLAGCAFASCKKDSTVPDVTKTIVLPSNGSSIVNANNVFGFNFLHSTLQFDNSNGNKLVSPLSIYMALSMVYNGAANATRDSIAKTLQLSGIDINDLNKVCNALITQLPSEDNKVKFSIANSIWYNKNSFQPLTSFLNTQQQFYNAETNALNFADPSSANTINNWVAEKTNQKIKSVIDATSPGDLMYLINAIYFNGAWKYAFKTSDTHADNFYLADGSSKSVSFMQQHLSVNYFSNDSFSLIELPYGGGNSYSMYIMLPKNNQQSISRFASTIDENSFTDGINKMDTVNINIYLPKWEYSYNIADMRPELAALGMGISFGDKADLSNMYNPAQVNPYITKAIHKTYIKVNEEGTEAAAVTSIAVGVTSVVPPPVLKIDHPFLYTIVEKQTGTILFTGIVNDPSLN